MTRMALWLIRAYRRVVSPLVGPCCRFYPSCSAYAEACLHEFGWLRGMTLAAGRVLRCHPWHRGGIDLPPVQGVEP